MLELTVTSNGEKVVLQLEHSLLSLSKWEAKTRQAFLGSAQKTSAQMVDYYRTMLLSPEVDPDLIYTLTPAQQDEITAYINSTPSATAPPAPDPDAPRHTGEQLTSDIIYMQMTMLRIPWHPAETWHLNRLLLQIALVADKQKPPKKEKPAGLLQKWQDLNEANKKFFKSDG